MLNSNELDPLMHHGEHDSLINDGGQDASHADLLTADGEHDSLINDGRVRVAGVDWDKPQSTNISLEGQDIFVLSPSRFISWYRDEAAKVCDVICFERPHLRARGDFSRAQIWLAEDLEKLVGGPPIMMPNGKKLRKMAEFAGNMTETKVKQPNGTYKIVMVPNKAKDSESIRKYAEAHPEIRRGWKRFTPPSQDTTTGSHVHRDALRGEVGQTINEWRESWQDVTGKDAIRELPHIAPCASILDRIFDDLSDECKAVFKLTRSKGTVNVSQGKTRVMTVYAMAFDKDHRLREHNGRPIGRRYLIKAVVGLCDSYMPNMARANLAGYGKTGQADVESRTRLNKAVKELLRQFQAHGEDRQQDPLTKNGGLDPLTSPGGLS